MIISTPRVSALAFALAFGAASFTGCALDDADDTGVTEAATTYCPLGHRWKPGVTSIPIWVSDANGDFVAKPTDDQVRATITAAVAELGENTNANISFYYAGRKHGLASNQWVPGAVVIHPVVSAPFDDATPGDADHDNYTDSCLVHLDAYSPGAGDTTIAHELMHCLGVHHPESCGLTDEALVSNAHSSGGSFRQYDIGALETIYGLRSTYQELSELLSSSGTTWNPSSYAPTTGWANARGPIVACNSMRHLASGLAFGDGTPRVGALGKATFATVEGSAWSTPGIACDENGTYGMAWTEQDATTHVATTHYGAWDGATWTTGAAATHGHEGDQLRGTYDPVTGRYIYTADVGGGDGYKYAADFSPGAPGWHLTAWRTASTPSIACGDVAVVGTDNCLMVWVDGGWDPTLRWSVGHLAQNGGNTGDWYFQPPSSTAHADGFHAVGSPSLAYTGNAAAPWMLVFHDGHAYLRVLTKPATTTSDWTQESVFDIVGSYRLVAPSLLSYSFPKCTMSGVCSYLKRFVVYARTWFHG